MSYNDFDNLKVKYAIEFEIVTLSPLSIRSGKSYVGPIDNPIVRIKKDEEEIPYIPGSSLKGVLRSEAEKYARTIGKDVCDILNPNKEPYGELTKKNKEKNEYKPCIICQIFGGPTIASHVYVYDSYPMNKEYSIGMMKRVTINRITSSQMPGKLFDVEFINPGSKFRGRIDIENIDILSDVDERAKILNYLFVLLYKNSIFLGGMKSTGMGSIKIENMKVTKHYIKDRTLSSEDKTSEYIEKIKLS